MVKTEGPGKIKIRRRRPSFAKARERKGVIPHGGRNVATISKKVFKYTLKFDDFQEKRRKTPLQDITPTRAKGDYGNSMNGTIITMKTLSFRVPYRQRSLAR